MKHLTTVRVCDTCPWLLKNQGKKHKAGWYSKANLMRLWDGLRSGVAPGMVCHSTDPDSINYGGDAAIKDGIKKECGGSLVMIMRNLNQLNVRKPQVDDPPITKRGIFYWANRILFGAVEGHPVPQITTEFDIDKDFGLPKKGENNATKLSTDRRITDRQAETTS